MLPGCEETVGVTAKDNRLFVEAMIYRYRAGIPWCDLPDRFGTWRIFTGVTSDGLRAASGNEFSIIWRKMPITNVR